VGERCMSHPRAIYKEHRAQPVDSPGEGGDNTLKTRGARL